MKKIFTYICISRCLFRLIFLTKKNKEIENDVEWIYEQHRSVNQKYDDLPYEFHLMFVASLLDDFNHLLDKETYLKVKLACYGHDLLEDTHLSYNDLKKRLGYFVADIIFSVTNHRGKTRLERANDDYYQGIVDNKYAVLVKLLDRIANVSYSKMSKSTMLKKYSEENPNFIKKLGYTENHQYIEVFNKLIEILKK